MFVRLCGVAVPEYCPSYYWYNHQLAEEHGVSYREHSFLWNPRTPRSLSRNPALLHVGAPTPEAAAAAASQSRASGGALPPTAATAAVPARATAARLVHALRSLAHAPLVHIPNLHGLTLLDAASTSGGARGGMTRNARSCIF